MKGLYDTFGDISFGLLDTLITSREFISLEELSSIHNLDRDVIRLQLEQSIDKGVIMELVNSSGYYGYLLNTGSPFTHMIIKLYKEVSDIEVW